MLLITSLSPHNVERQRPALQSWGALDLPIVSLNATAEADAVHKAFADVRVEPVDRSAMATLGKPLVLLDSVWEFAPERA